MLTDFTIKNFRGIKELTLPSLKRVNLFVGKNGVGKTSVLEAVELWVRNLSPRAMLDILDRRGESGIRLGTTPVDEIFHNDFKDLPVVRFETSGATQYTGMKKGALLALGTKNEGMKIAQVSDDSILDLALGDERVAIPLGNPMAWPPPRPPRCNYIYIPSIGMAGDAMNRLWTSLYIYRVDRFVLRGLQVLFPEIDDVNHTQLPIVGRKGDAQRIPLARLGEGGLRVFGFALGLAAARDGVLLIDEFENGLHYSIQPEIWRFVLTVAAEFNVQIFATTHSRDTVHALAEASNEDDHIVYRLEHYKGQLQAVEFDREHLDTVAEYAVEIR